MIEPLLIEAGVLGIVGAVLWLRQRKTQVPNELPETFLEGVAALQDGDHARAIERLSPSGAAELEPLRLGWLALAQYAAGRRNEALSTFRRSGVANPEWVLIELAESQPGSLAADQVVALARQLPTDSSRAIEARLRVFERESRDGDLWSSLQRCRVPIRAGVAARTATRALAEGLRVSSDDIERFDVPASAVERANLMKEFERHGAVRRSFEEAIELLGRARRETCSDLVVESSGDLGALWADLHGLSRPTGESPVDHRRVDGPSLAIQTLAESPTEQFFETIRTWSGGSLRGPLARNIARAARARGPRLLREIAEAPTGVLRVDRIRLCVIHLAVRSADPSASSVETLGAGFARIEVVEAFFVLPFEIARPLMLELGAELFRSLRSHPRPDAGFLFECLDVPELAPRALEWLRERPDLVADHVCLGLRDDGRRPIVRRHMHRLPRVAAASLVRAMAAESEPVTEWVDAFLELGEPTIDALLDCAGSPPLEALADWLARRLPSECRAVVEQRIARSTNERERRFLQGLLGKIGRQVGGGVS